MYVSVPWQCDRDIEDGPSSHIWLSFQFCSTESTWCLSTWSAKITSERKPCGFLAKNSSYLDLSRTSCHHFSSSRHVQLQLLPGQVWSGGKGAPAQTQRKELRLLHEDRLLLLLSDPVPHHRQPGALPHLWTAREVSRGEESRGQWFLLVYSPQLILSAINHLI